MAIVRLIILASHGLIEMFYKNEGLSIFLYKLETDTIEKWAL